MNCIVCESPMSFYFSKYFGQYELNNVDYWLCPQCGFTASKTHFDLAQAEWETLNINFHNAHNLREDDPYNRHQRYFNQAQMLYLMQRHGLIPAKKWLDWGSGEGDVSLQLKEHFDLKLRNFDHYIKPRINHIRKSELENMKAACNLVMCTAVFEHLRDGQILNEIESFVSKAGCFAIHTLVRGQIPKDPEWMYLLPVHCAFFTNKSMQMLMDRWGYTCSVYNEYAKMWVFFRHKKPSEIGTSVSYLNIMLGWEYLHFKTGFMDYWP